MTLTILVSILYSSVIWLIVFAIQQSEINKLRKLRVCTLAINAQCEECLEICKDCEKKHGVWEDL
jgi:hypothetical protein